MIKLWNGPHTQHTRCSREVFVVIFLPSRIWIWYDTAPLLAAAAVLVVQAGVCVVQKFCFFNQNRNKSIQTYVFSPQPRLCDPCLHLDSDSCYLTSPQNHPADHIAAHPAERDTAHCHGNDYSVLFYYCSGFCIFLGNYLPSPIFSVWEKNNLSIYSMWSGLYLCPNLSNVYKSYTHHMRVKYRFISRCSLKRHTSGFPAVRDLHASTSILLMHYYDLY